MTAATANSILMGGGGAPSAKFSTPGDTITGRIIAISEPYQEREYSPTDPGNGAPKFFKNGNPIMTFNLDLATTLRDPAVDDDDGTRRVYMDGARIKKAVRAAVQAVGADGLAVGATLSITYTHDDVTGDHRSGKNYQVTYTPGAASNNVLMGQADEPATPAPAPQPHNTALTPQAPTQAAPPAAPQQAQGGPSREQIAALKAAGIDPATVFPNWQG